MLKKLQNLLFEDDDEFVEDNTEAEQVSASAPVTPTVQPQVTPVEETAQIPVQPELVSEIPPVPTTPVEPEPVKTSSVFLDNEPKKSTMINLDDEDSKPVEKKPAVKPEVKREEVKPSK
ncbi:MAG: hypothetical protein HXL44_04515, partial [Solobacterium sp.]|nr:hypothetical protein [Solobacterium sp.]